MSIDDYVKAWPAGLMKYELAPLISLPNQTSQFLQEVGLPLGREPEWIFDGIVHPLAQDVYAFGMHFVTQLALDENGTVYEYDAGNMLFLNSGVEELAYCLTFRKKASRGRVKVQSEEDFRRFQQSILEIDPKALTEGSYWATMLTKLKRRCSKYDSSARIR
ncbi:MAG: SUKH-4 family immunity protein [Pirellulaceae bacterium]